MKKIIIIMLSMLMLISAGCSRRCEDDAKPSETASAPQGTEAVQTADATAESILPTEQHNTEAPGKLCFDYRQRTFASEGSTIFETDTSLYCLVTEKVDLGGAREAVDGNSFIMFTDKEYRDWMPLCSKPNCMHDNASCDACANSICGISLYGEHIYYVDRLYSAADAPLVTFPELWRMKPDGTAHERLLKLPSVQTDAEPEANSWSGVFTNKYLIMDSVALFADAESDSIVTESIHYLIDLETLSCTMLEKDPFGQEYAGGMPLVGEGSLLYMACVRSDSSGTDAGIYLCEIDCAAAECRYVGDMPYDVFLYEGNCMLCNGRFYFISVHMDRMTIELYEMDLSSGEYVSITEQGADRAEFYNMDQQNGMLFCSIPFGSAAGLYFCGSDLKRIDMYSYADAPEELSKLMIAYQTESYIFGILPSKDGLYEITNTVPTWYIDKSEIGTGNLQWHKWEPEG